MSPKNNSGFYNICIFNTQRRQKLMAIPLNFQWKSPAIPVYFVFSTWVNLVVWAFDGATVDGGSGDDDAVQEATFQARDGALSAGGVTTCTRVITADGYRSVHANIAKCSSPLHQEGIGRTVELCFHPVRQTWSWRRKTTDSWSYVHSWSQSTMSYEVRSLKQHPQTQFLLYSEVKYPIIQVIIKQG